MLTQSTILSLLAGAMASPMLLKQRQSCPEIHIFGARETTASPGYGSAGAVVDSIVAAFPGATSEAIDYPASGDNPPYAESEATGVANVCSQVQAFASQCPESQLVVVGYSQGGEIFDDALCGGGSCSIADYNVKAAIFMGAPTYVSGLPYNVGTCAAGGFDAKPAGSSCASGALDDAVQSYCDAADPYCCNGSDTNTHNGYATEYGADALAFVQSRLSSGGSTGASPSGVASSAVAAAPSSAATSAAVSFGASPSSAAVSFGSPSSAVAAVPSSAATPVMWGC